MGSRNNRVITITMPQGLLIQVDVLAKKEFASRSDILRQAALAYVRQSDLDANEAERLSPKYTDQRSKPETKPKQETKRDYDQIVKHLAKKHPYAHLYDKALLSFLDDYERGRL